MVRVGFYGKLPSRGDFVRVGLSRRLTLAWDDWVASVLPAVSLPALGTWRLALSPGVCGPDALAGVWLPSTDRVGRAFPLLLAAEAAEPTTSFLAAAERIGTEAIGACHAPGELAQALADAPCPAPAEAPAMGVARFWRSGLQASFCGASLPTADTLAALMAS